MNKPTHPHLRQVPMTGSDWKKRAIKLYWMMKDLDEFLSFQTQLHPREDFAKLVCRDKRKTEQLNRLFSRINHELSAIEKDITGIKEEAA